MLPQDLRTAEAEALEALRSALTADSRGRWSVELRFEGLRLLPVVVRLATGLVAEGKAIRLLFPDAGAAALARRDAPDLAPMISSFSDQLRALTAAPETDSDALLLLVSPSQADYDSVEQLCSLHSGAVVLLNPGLEDAAVGIGSVARQRRKGFLATLQSAYALLPLTGSALRRQHPEDWELYRLDPDGYRFVASFDHRPDGEERDAALLGAGGSGLSATLRSVDRLLEGLQR